MSLAPSSTSEHGDYGFDSRRFEQKLFLAVEKDIHEALQRGKRRIRVLESQAQRRRKSSAAHERCHCGSRERQPCGGIDVPQRYPQHIECSAHHIVLVTI
jgi:hypothetical protein